MAHLSFLHAKQLLMKLLSETLQTSANLLLELMPANYTPFRCASPCPPVFIRVGISIQKPVDSDLGKTRPVPLKIWSCLIFNVQDLIIKLRASTLQADMRKLIASVLMGFVLIATLCLRQWAAFTTFVPVKSCAHLSLKKLSNEAVGEENSMNWDEAIYRRKVSLSSKCVNVSGGDSTRLPLRLNYISENFLYRRSLTEQQLLEGMKKGSLFGYVQCDIEVPENLRVNFVNFPPIFKNTLVSKNDFGDLMKTYAEEGGRMSQPRKMLISSFTLQNRTLITPLLLFYLQLGLVVTKYTVLSSTLQRNASTVSCSQQWTQEGKVTEIPIQVSPQKQWSF